MMLMFDGDGGDPMTALAQPGDRPETDDQLATLLQSYADGELTASTITAMSQLFSLQTVPANYLLTKQGAPGYDMYLLVDGQAEVRWHPFGRTNDRNLTRVVATVGAGDLVGEMSLLFNKPRSADVVTLTETVAYKLSKSDWIHLSDRFQGFRSRVEQVAEDRRGAVVASASGLRAA
jgi:CRP-like cAMP-binding protein